MNTDTSNGTKIRIHEKLLETGEYDKIKTFLRSKLLEAGWFDKVNVLALDQLSTQEKPNFEAVAESIEAKALGMFLSLFKGSYDGDFSDDGGDDQVH